MTVTATEDTAFRYVAINRAGKQVKDVVRARDSRAAARALVAEGLTPVTLTEEKGAVSGGGKNRDLTFSERVLVLRQLALMVEAGVGLLEAMQTVSTGIAATKGRAKFEAVIVALKRGDYFANAMESHAPGFPFYLYAMVRVGESTGRIAEVLNDAAEQMAYEHKLRREFIGSLIYPMILIVLAIGVMIFMCLVIVPTFRNMVEDTSNLPAISKAVFGLSAFMQHNMLQLGLGVVGFAFVCVAIGSNKTFRTAAYNTARNLPVLGGIFKARELGSWSRVMAFSLTNGLGLLDAATLARQAAPKGKFNQNLDQFERDLKSGVEVAESLSRHTRLTTMDLSLLRAGQKSGTLPKMFTYVADGYDATLRDRMKALSTIIQPLTIVIVAIMVATLIIGVMMALMSVYLSIQ